MLSKEDVEKALPANLKSAATQSFTDQINNIVADPLVAENIRNNFVGYTHILKEGRFKTEDYLHAVVYVSYKLMGYSNQEAYQRTFPARYQTLLQKGVSSKDISAYVAAYHRGKLVGLILEQTLTPVWVLNQDIYQKAISTQADLMLNANSEKVRSDAANSILTHLARPKEVALKGKIEFEATESSGMTELKGMLSQLAQQQQDLIDAGVNTKEIAGASLIEHKASDDGA